MTLTESVIGCEISVAEVRDMELSAAAEVCEVEDRFCWLLTGNGNASSFEETCVSNVTVRRGLVGLGGGCCSGWDLDSDNRGVFSEAILLYMPAVCRST